MLKIVMFGPRGPWGWLHSGAILHMDMPELKATAREIVTESGCGENMDTVSKKKKLPLRYNKAPRGDIVGA